MLTLIWTLSLILSALSIAVMAALIARRTVIARRDRHHAASRKQVMTAMIRLTHDNDADSFLAVVEGVPEAVTADASSEFLGLVRGGERELVLAALRRAGQPAFLQKELFRANEVRRLMAVELIAAYPAELARPALLDRLNRDKSREVRLAAAIELAKIDAVPSLTELLDKIGYRGQRSGRLGELFRLLPADGEPQLMDLARDIQAPVFLRASAVEALWRRDGLFDPSIFVDLAKDPVAEVAAAALRALGRVMHRPALPLIASKLDHPDWEVRMEAADAVGRLGDSSLVARLGDLLDDEQWTVRYRAAQSLRRLGSAGQGALLAMAGQEPSRKQRTASLVLSEGSSA